MHVRSMIATAAAVSLVACGSGRMTSPAPPIVRLQSQALSAQSTGSEIFTLGDGGSNAAFAGDVRLGADGKLYYTTSGDSTTFSGEYGSFDPASHAQTYSTVSYRPGPIAETARGIWVEEAGNASGKATIDRYNSIGGSDTPIILPIGASQDYPNGITGGFAVAPDGRLWWASNFSAQVGSIDQQTNAVSVYTVPTPPGDNQPWLTTMTIGSDGHLWVTDSSNDGLHRISTTGSSVGTGTYVQFSQGNGNETDLAGVVSGDDARIYAGSEGLYNSAGYLNVGPETASPSFETTEIQSDWPARLAAAPGKIYFSELQYGSLGIYDTVAHTVTVLPLTAQADGYIAVDGSGNPWLSCRRSPYGSAQTACIETMKLKSVWEIFPHTNLTVFLGNYYNALPPALAGIGETGNSAPFTVSSLNTAVCKARMLERLTHNFFITPLQVGTCAVTVVDAHGRSVTMNVTVKQTGQRQP